jgi:hypothetical protein
LKNASSAAENPNGEFRRFSRKKSRKLPPEVCWGFAPPPLDWELPGAGFFDAFSCADEGREKKAEFLRAAFGPEEDVEGPDAVEPPEGPEAVEPRPEEAEFRGDGPPVASRFTSSQPAGFCRVLLRALLVVVLQRTACFCNLASPST